MYIEEFSGLCLDVKHKGHRNIWRGPISGQQLKWLKVKKENIIDKCVLYTWSPGKSPKMIFNSGNNGNVTISNQRTKQYILLKIKTKQAVQLS